MNTDRVADSTPSQAASSPYASLRLLYAPDSKADESRTWAFSSKSLMIGRLECPESIGLGDRRVSERHAIVSLQAGGSAPIASIKDLGSTNGLFVNGHRVTAATLSDGDLIRVGCCLLLFRMEDASLGELGTELEFLEELLRGESPSIRELRYELAAAAPEPVEVLLLGESGSGKELAARGVHLASPRRSGPFVALNCATIPAALAESQLFGHAAGAFTGAREKNSGFFVAAHGGTLFLDEIGELSPELQPKLLRVLEERQVTPVGGTTARSVDVRIVAATNRDLRGAVAAGDFRGDLYARLASYPIRLPPLRQRREDILPLLLHFYGELPPRISPRLAEALVLYAWPYNVRELKKMAEAMRVLSRRHSELDLPHVTDRLWPLDKGPIELPGRQELRLSGTSLPVGQPGTDHQASSRKQAHQHLSRETLARLLAEHRGVISYVAEAAGRSRKHIRRLIEQFGLDKNVYRSP